MENFIFCEIQEILYFLLNTVPETKQYNFQRKIRKTESMFILKHPLDNPFTNLAIPVFNDTES